MRDDSAVIEGDYQDISSTARLVAYWRALSDIPYSKDIAEYVDAEETLKGFFGEERGIISVFMSPYIEARYKSINDSLRREGIENVLEIAMGFSPRGLEYTSAGNIYVGTDLPEMLMESSDIISRVAEKYSLRTENLYLEPVNVFDREQIEEAARHFDEKVFAVCNEGLLIYQDAEKKAQTAVNIRNVLVKHKGIWITPDIDTLDKMEERIKKYPSPVFKEIREKSFDALYEKTNCEVIKNFFRDEKEAIRFYKDLGFNVELKPFYNVNNLKTFQRVPEYMRAYITDWIHSKRTWVMRPRE